MDKIKTSLIIGYLSAWVLVILSAVVGFWLTQKGYTVTNPANVRTIKSILLMYVLVSVPLSLYLLNRQNKSLINIETISQRLVKYRTWTFITIGIITIGLIASILYCYLLVQKDLLFLAGIVALSLLLVKPSQKKLQSDYDRFIEPKNEEEENQ